MKDVDDALPVDVATLQEMVRRLVAERDLREEAHAGVVAEQKRQLRVAQQKIEWLLRKLFARSSEKLDPRQLSMSFAEASAAVVESVEVEDATTEIAAPDEAAANHPLLRALHAAALAQFDPAGTRAEPLLPAAAAPLEQRAEALVEWCRGFLGGYGLAGAPAGATPSSVASDVLSDFGTIAGSRFDYDDEAEDARAFADVLEFVREAVALLHRESRQRTVTLARALH